MYKPLFSLFEQQNIEILCPGFLEEVDLKFPTHIAIISKTYFC